MCFRGIIRYISIISLLVVGMMASAGIRVSVLTVAPGKEIFQLEGHTALRIVVDDFGEKTVTDSVVHINASYGRHSDIVVNWGVFDFASPNFVGRFVKGETDYMAVAYPTGLFLGEYIREGRRVVEQVIDLTPEQAENLMSAVADNLRPENSVYRYNYVLDNCATRPMEMLQRYADTLSDDAFGDAKSCESTFRGEMRKYHASYPWYQFGIDLALGSSIDENISERQMNFAPVQFQKTLEHATKSDGTPVVAQTHVLVGGDEAGVADDPTPWPLTPMAVGLYLLIATLIISYWNLCKHTASRWFDSVLYGVFGLLGCLLTFLIFFSSHYGASPNLLYLWLNPLCLLIAAGVWIKSWQCVVYWLQICNFVAVVMLFVAWAAGMQNLNAAFAPFMLSGLLRSALYVYNCKQGVYFGTLVSNKPTLSKKK